MKKECLICNEMFDALNGAKFCPECRAAGKKICTRCGTVFFFVGILIGALIVDEL